jgi:hypothetical protein
LAHLIHKTYLKWCYKDMKIVVLQVGTQCNLVGSYWCQEKLAATYFMVDSNPENGICLQDYKASQTKDQNLNSHTLKSSKLTQK